MITDKAKEKAIKRLWDYLYLLSLIISLILMFSHSLFGFICFFTLWSESLFIRKIKLG